MRVAVFTTTKQFPAPDKTQRNDNTHWPPTAHPRGRIIEVDFARHRCSLSGFLPAAPLWLNQVHGTRVFDVDTLSSEAIRAAPPEADAAFTRAPDTVLAILTADCLPVVLIDEQHEVVAAAHAGWRGLATGVLENTVEKMKVAPERLNVWLGPAIGAAAFEVGEDVFAEFNGSSDREAAACFSKAANDKWHADLYGLARLRLRRLGVTRISGGDFCTYTDHSRFYSYRKKKDEGRMATFVWLISEQ